ncbi:filaggrin-2-like [Vanessa cardui]|uniref:filaggrin-2-like n=1 Tax=Vanessa cardui TaxID=171605 RepID=UPI001F138FEE|nr:filaggrin-2-like [Vanessa cardui]
MARLILISGFCLLAVATQAATYRDAQLHRVVRSPHYGVHVHDNQPPPPFIYRTHNWSGVGRNIDGAVGGVFSGAAASAQSAIPASNAAFSLAEAGAVQGQFEAQSAESANSASKGFKNSDHYSSNSESSSHKFGSSSDDYSKSKSGNSNSEGYSGLNSHITRDESSGFAGQSEQNSGSIGFGQESNRGYGQTSSINSGYTGNSGGYGGGFSKNFKESHTQAEYVSNGGGNQFGSQQSGVNRNQRNFDEGRQVYSGGLSSSQAQTLSSGNNNGQYASSQGSAHSGSNGYGYGHDNGRSEVRGYESQADGSETFKGQLKSTLGSEHSAGFSSSQAQSSSSDNSGRYASAQGSAQSDANGYGYGNDNRHSEVRGYKNHAYGSGSFKAQELKSTEESGGYGGAVGGTVSNNGAGYGQHQSALHGALELASQGLQTAKNTECSTCQKSTYALSNAKSHSGSAIALSIGG